MNSIVSTPLAVAVVLLDVNVALVTLATAKYTISPAIFWSLLSTLSLVSPESIAAVGVT